MIGIEGQYVLSFSIGDKKDFIRTEDLGEFQIVEECGNLLPIWKISFTTFDTELERYWNEGNQIKMSLGKSRDKMVDSLLVITEKSIVPINNKILFTAVGLYDALCFVNTPHTRTLGPYSGIEVANAIAGMYFKIDKNNPTTSNDSQVWKQTKQTDKKFLEEVLLHSYLKESSVGYGISLDGRYLIRDLRNWCKKDFKFRFTTTTEKANDIPYVDVPIFTSNSGFINSWIGYGRERVLKMEGTGNNLYHQPLVKAFLAVGEMLKNPKVSKLLQPPVKQSSNLDPNYWIAASNNSTGLARLGTECCQLTYMNRIDEIDLFDVCMVRVDEPNKKFTSKTNSGLYIIGSISRKVEGSGSFRVSTTVKLFRESPNDFIVKELGG